jgi:hypothetical protein
MGHLFLPEKIRSEENCVCLEWTQISRTNLMLKQTEGMGAWGESILLVASATAAFNFGFK